MVRCVLRPQQQSHKDTMYDLFTLFIKYLYQIDSEYWLIGWQYQSYWSTSFRCLIFHLLKCDLSASLVVVKNLSAKAEDWIRSLHWEDPTCWGTTKPVNHNHWAHVLEPRRHNYWAHMPQVLRPVHPRALCSAATEARAWEIESIPCSSKLEKSPSINKDPTQT